MFYQCPKCQKKWQYQITKCPDCFVVLEKMRNGKIKVIGISRVNIPTLLHPNVPYFVLVLEDEKGNKWAQKSIEEYNIGQEFKIETKENKNTVAVWRIKYDILEGMEKVIDLLGGVKVNQDSKILILPTLLAPKHPHLAENTSPQFLENIIKYLLQKNVGAENIKVASQSFNEISIEASAQKSQLLRVCLENKITPLDLSKENFVKKEKNGIVFEISKEVFNNDLIINLPILKLDSKLKLRGAAENVLKFLKKESYLSLQYLHNYQDLLKKIQGVLPDYLTLAESISIQKQDKYTAFLGLILASFSPFNLDRVFAEITMLKDLPEHLKDIKIEHIPITGRQVEELKYDVEKSSI